MLARYLLHAEKAGLETGGPSQLTVINCAAVSVRTGSVVDILVFSRTTASFRCSVASSLERRKAKSRLGENDVIRMTNSVIAKANYVTFKASDVTRNYRVGS